MKNNHFICILICLTCLSCKRAGDDWHDLLNWKDFSNWNIYVAVPSNKVNTEAEMTDTITYLAPKAHLTDNPDTSVFRYITVDNKKMLYISGELIGFLTTDKAYQNYHLKLKFRYGKKWAWMGKRPRDGGIIYHVVNDNKISWQNEFNIHDGDIGSYWSFGGIADIPSSLSAQLPASIKTIIPIIRPVIPSLKDTMYVFDPKGQIRTFGESIPGMQICVANPVTDKACGEWNVLELICVGDTIVHVVNGKVNMVMYHSRYKKDNQTLPLKSGLIKIQSEGGEQFVEYIKIRNIKKIPEEFRYALSN